MFLCTYSSIRTKLYLPYLMIRRINRLRKEQCHGLYLSSWECPSYSILILLTTISMSDICYSENDFASSGLIYIACWLLNLTFISYHCSRISMPRSFILFVSLISGSDRIQRSISFYAGISLTNTPFSSLCLVCILEEYFVKHIKHCSS